MSSSVSILLFFKLVHDIEKEREVVEEHRHAIPKSIFLFPESLICRAFLSLLLLHYVNLLLPRH